MKIQTSCTSLCVVLAVLAIYCAGCGSLPSKQGPATVTEQVPLATAKPPTSFPTFPLPTEMSVATQTPPIVTDAPTLLPTLTRKEGWVDFVNGYYGYAISLPPSAVVTKNDKIDHVQAELPAGMEPGEYFDRLNRTYPPGICISVSYQSAYLNINVQDSLGGSLAKPCGRSRLGDVDPVLTEEEVFVGEVSYPATHAITYESDAPGAKSLEEFYYVNMDDGGLISFGGEWKDQAAYDQYLSDKAVLLEILRSYRSVPRTELFCPEPAPTRLKAGGYAYVSTDSPLTDNNIRSAPGINQDLIGSIVSGTAVELLEGPVCNNSLQWWEVRVLETGLVGWTPEGDPESFWLIACESKQNCGAP